ncbi:MAG: hydrogenase iron-sulfur subunit [Pseudomonadota bacterium]
MRASAIQSVFLNGARRPQEPSRRVLVLGGDSTGLLTAERLSYAGFPVLLLGHTADTQVPDGVTLVTDAVLEEIQGFVGAFDAVIRKASGRVIERGAFVVAAQPAEAVPKFEEYRLVRSQRIVSLSDVEDILLSGGRMPARQGEWFHAAFLVGLSGESEPAVFSRVLSVIEQLRQLENVQPYVFTRNLKVAADGLEGRYRECRESGTLFFKFDDAGPVFEDSARGTVMVFDDPLLGQEMELIPDLLVVDEHVSPAGSLKPLLDATPLSFLSSPFLQPDSTRFPGVETPRAGIFAVGPARGMFDPAVIALDAELVVAGIEALLRKSPDAAVPGPPAVDPAKCTMCLTCLRLCPHGAVTFGKTAQVDPMTCVGCGICAVECPMEAISLAPPEGGSDIESQIREGLAAATGPGKILAFVCSRSADQALGAVGAGMFGNLIPVVVRCAGTIGIPHVLSAFRHGADAVMAAGCFQGNCASGYGTVLAAERIAQVQDMLSDMGIDPGLVQFVPVAGNTPEALRSAVRAMENRIGGRMDNR